MSQISKTDGEIPQSLGLNSLSEPPSALSPDGTILILEAAQTAKAYNVHSNLASPELAYREKVNEVKKNQLKPLTHRRPLSLRFYPSGYNFLATVDVFNEF